MQKNIRRMCTRSPGTRVAWAAIFGALVTGCAELLGFDEYTTPCEPGAAVACPYGGPPGTEGVGACRAGMGVCAPDGSTVLECSGEVTPAVELCGADGVDESCDGEPACTGAHRWIKAFGDASGQSALALAMDDAGDIVVTGMFSGSPD